MRVAYERRYTVCRMLLATILSGCAAASESGELPVSPPALQPPSMVVTPESLTLSVGDAGLFAARLSHFQGDTTVIWSSSSDSVATVTTSGEVRGLRAGEVVITATLRARASLRVSRPVVIR